jgi:hypothetical protein
MSKGYEKDETLEFYSGLMSDVYHLKITRDRIMHTRESFDAVGLDGNKDDSAALAVYGDVKRFMQRLAAKILKTIPPPR